jgi:hypothetical protein
MTICKHLNVTADIQHFLVQHSDIFLTSTDDESSEMRLTIALQKLKLSQGQQQGLS